MLPGKIRAVRLQRGPKSHELQNRRMQFMRQEAQALRHASDTLLKRVEYFLRVGGQLTFLRSQLVDFINDARELLTYAVMKISRNPDAFGFLTLDQTRGQRSIQFLSPHAFENFVLELFVKSCKFRRPL